MNGIDKRTDGDFSYLFTLIKTEPLYSKKKKLLNEVDLVFTLFF